MTDDRSIAEFFCNFIGKDKISPEHMDRIEQSIATVRENRDLKESLYDYLICATEYKDNNDINTINNMYLSFDRPRRYSNQYYKKQGLKPFFHFYNKTEYDVHYGKVARFLLAMQDFSVISNYDDMTHYDKICKALSQAPIQVRYILSIAAENVIDKNREKAENDVGKDELIDMLNSDFENCLYTSRGRSGEFATVDGEKTEKGEFGEHYTVLGVRIFYIENGKKTQKIFDMPFNDFCLDYRLADEIEKQYFTHTFYNDKEEER